MIFHTYDPITRLYIETIDIDSQPENSVEGKLPELTEFYTVARIDDTWVSVLRPEFEIINNEIDNRKE